MSSITEPSSAFTAPPTSTAFQNGGLSRPRFTARHLMSSSRRPATALVCALSCPIIRTCSIVPARPSCAGARPAIPPKRTDAPVACPPWIYANRHLVENLWARLKEWRAIATRYEKTATSFLGVLSFAATLDWLRS